MPKWERTLAPTAIRDTVLLMYSSSSPGRCVYYAALSARCSGVQSALVIDNEIRRRRLLWSV